MYKSFFLSFCFLCGIACAAEAASPSPASGETNAAKLARIKQNVNRRMRSNSHVNAPRISAAAGNLNVSKLNAMLANTARRQAGGNSPYLNYTNAANTVHRKDALPADSRPAGGHPPLMRRSAAAAPSRNGTPLPFVTAAERANSPHLRQPSASGAPNIRVRTTKNRDGANPNRFRPAAGRNTLTAVRQTPAAPAAQETAQPAVGKIRNFLRKILPFAGGGKK